MGKNKDKCVKKPLYRQEVISYAEKMKLNFFNGHLYYPLERMLVLVQKKDKDDNKKPNYSIERKNCIDSLTLYIPKEVENNCGIIQTYCANMGFKFICAGEEYETNFRLVVGLGGSSVVGNSITIHHTYGIPYIPAQALKGVMRYYLRNYCDEIFDTSSKEEQKLMEMILFGTDIENNELKTLDLDEKNRDEIAKIIGKGCLLFFDAFPAGEYTLKKDVMCAHNKKYYEDTGAAPKDTEDPEPIFFYTVSDTAFKIYIALNKMALSEERLKKLKALLGQKYKNIDKVLKDQIESKLTALLTKSLRDNGIGAKTSVGYGSLVKKS